jgi:hypothetical protein
MCAKCQASKEEAAKLGDLVRIHAGGECIIRFDKNAAFTLKPGATREELAEAAGTVADQLTQIEKVRKSAEATILMLTLAAGALGERMLGMVPARTSGEEQGQKAASLFAQYSPAGGFKS